MRFRLAGPTTVARPLIARSLRTQWWRSRRSPGSLPFERVTFYPQDPVRRYSARDRGVRGFKPSSLHLGGWVSPVSPLCPSLNGVSPNFRTNTVDFRTSGATHSFFPLVPRFPSSRGASKFSSSTTTSPYSDPPLGGRIIVLCRRVPQSFVPPFSGLSFPPGRTSGRGRESDGGWSRVCLSVFV